MTSSFIFWLWFSWVTFFALGLITVRRELSFKLDTFPALGRVFVAASLAGFGAEHLAGPGFVIQAVPTWMPGRLFWTYFVGCALIAVAISLALGKYMFWPASLLGLMLFLFVLMIHVPRVAASPGDRFAWAVVLRDLSFACGAWTFAAIQRDGWRTQGDYHVIGICRFILALVFLFFGVEHVLHPEFLPGVPLNKMTPAWIPVRALWGYLTGAMLLSGGVALLIDKHARSATAVLGIWLTLVVVFLYLPVLASAAQPADMLVALNFIGDTMLFAGVVLFAAEAAPREPGTPR